MTDKGSFLEYVRVSFLGFAVIFSIAAKAGDDPAPAQTEKPQQRAAEVNAKQAVGEDEIDGPTILEGVPGLNWLDDLRDRLRDDRGVYFHGSYIGDPYANLAGGLRRGATYSGRLDAELDIDAGKLLGIPGGALHANVYQIHGVDLSQNFIGNFLSTNDIAALPTTRLYELWYEQKFGDQLAVRAGQIGIDVEFLTSNYAASFIDASFGWPGLLDKDLPSGGPAYPLASPAVRVKFDPSRDLSFLAAVFDGDPAGPGPGDPQARDRYGLNFRLSDPPLIIAEAQYRYNQGVGAAGLPGTFKLGAFAHLGQFDDQRFGADGLPLAVAYGGPLQHSPDGGVYAIIDQQIYHAPGADPEKGIGVFARAIDAPSDRNLVDLYFDAGVSALGLVPGRPNDLVGVAGAFARISPWAAAADADASLSSGVNGPVRSFEAVLEVTYQAQIIPGVSLQPTFQYFVNPGGNVGNPYAAALTPIRNASVFGVTTIIRF